MSILIGCIADDLTGATDLAMILAREGLKTIQVVGVPETGLDLSDADAVVIALKSRTIPVKDAVDLSLHACDWLKASGAGQIFFKYCSTFDSTDAGNIGPVTDALMTQLGAPVTIACPAFPENGRTVYKGHLFVNDCLLSESSLRHHPLTPMHDSKLSRVLAKQSSSHVGNIYVDQVEQGAPSILKAMLQPGLAEHTIFIVDATNNTHLRSIGMAAKDLPLVTGGSAVAMGLVDNFKLQGLLRDETTELDFFVSHGKTVVLAGSCSETTLAQVDHAKRLMPSFRIDAKALLCGKPVVSEVLRWAVSHGDQEKKLLIYSSATPDELALVQEEGDSRDLGSSIESIMGELAYRLSAEQGVHRFVVAGGETSGAVINALKVKSLQIGPTIETGVPWTKSTDGSNLALALKSGNFGSVDFFLKAIKKLDCLSG